MTPTQLQRNPARNLLATLALAGLTAIASAQPAQKIAVVDMGKLFNNFYKTKQAGSTLEERRQDILKVQKGLYDDYQKAQEEFNKLKDGIKDPSISKEESAKREKAATSKLEEVKEMEANIRKYTGSAEESFGQQKVRMKQKMIGEIREVIEAKAKADGYALVLDSVGVSMNEAPVVLYNNGQNDITEDVLKKLNENAPAMPAKSEETKDKPAETKPGEKKDTGKK